MLATIPESKWIDIGFLPQDLQNFFTKKEAEAPSGSWRDSLKDKPSSLQRSLSLEDICASHKKTSDRVAPLATLLSYLKTEGNSIQHPFGPWISSSFPLPTTEKKERKKTDLSGVLFVFVMQRSYLGRPKKEHSDGRMIS